MCCGKGRTEAKPVMLRKDYSVADRRLDALPQFDQRSKLYKASEKVDDGAKRIKSWKTPTPLDQGQEGACVGMGITHFLMSEPGERQERDESFARKEIYVPAQIEDEFGETPPEEGTSLLAGLKIAKNKGFISEYRWTFSVEELQIVLGNTSGVILALPWYTGMLRTDAAAWIRPNGSMEGRHCIYAYAVQPDQWIEVLNSWGPDWGAQGRARISIEDLDRLLHEQGEAAVPVKRNSVAGLKKKK